MDHRTAVGGLWDEIGTLQFEYLRSQGLRPEHRFLDVGCGCMRAGVHLARYLQPGHYYGFDPQQWLLDAGQGELAAVGAPPAVTRCTETFDVRGWPQFDFAIAQSVFTHLTLDRFGACLRSIAPNLRYGTLYATFFEGAHGVRDLPHQPGDVVTHFDADPYHFEPADILRAAHDAGWHGTWIGDWRHPRDQKIASFRPA
jgi:hypothetical protein